MLLNRYGSQYGALPQTMGNVFFVAPAATGTIGGAISGIAYVADNANSGLTPEQPLRTIGQAVSNAVANNGDIIVLMPGTHSVAAAAISKAGLTFIGMPYFPEAAVGGYHGWQPQVTITGAATIALAITAADCSFYNIRFLPVTAQIAVTMTTAAARTKFVHCMVDNTGVVGSASTQGIAVTTANLPRGVTFLGCIFKDASVTTSHGAALLLAASVDFLLKDCIIYKDGQIASAQTWTTAVVLESGCTGTLIDVNYFGSEVSVGTTKVFTAASLAGAGVVHALRCNTTVNTGGLMFDDFAAADMDLCLCYIGTVAGGTGGTLNTVST